MKMFRYICSEAWPFGVKHAPRSVITGLIFFIKSARENSLASAVG